MEFWATVALAYALLGNSQQSSCCRSFEGVGAEADTVQDGKNSVRLCWRQTRLRYLLCLQMTVMALSRQSATECLLRKCRGSLLNRMAISMVYLGAGELQTNKEMHGLYRGCASRSATCL